MKKLLRCWISLVQVHLNNFSNFSEFLFLAIISRPTNLLDYYGSTGMEETYQSDITGGNIASIP